MNKLLLQYLRLAIQEARLARVPNQLIDIEDVEDENMGEEVDEHSAVAGGNLQGTMAPTFSSRKNSSKK